MCATAVRSAVTHLRPTLIAALACGSLLAACSSSDGPSGPGTNVFFGVLANSSGVGTGSVTLRILDDNSGGSGSFTVEGTQYAITNLQVNGGQVTGAGGGYTFTGTVGADEISGTWTTQTDNGIFTVSFVPPAQSGTAYCGSHIGTLAGGQPVGGVLSLVTVGTSTRGVLTSAGPTAFESEISGTGTDVFEEFTGDADLVVAADHFDGTYSTAAGDDGAAEGHLCGTSGPGGTSFIGVVGDFPGTGTGTIGFTVGSSNATSSGNYNVGGTPVNFDAVIVGVGNQVIGFSGTAIFRGTIAGTSLDGTWYTGSTPNGLMAATEDQGNIVLYCGSNNATGAGSFAFALIGAAGGAPRALHGVYTGGFGNGFQGTVEGLEGDNAGTMSGQTGNVTVLPDPTSFGGFFDFSGGGGLSGTMTGTLCP